MGRRAAPVSMEARRRMTTPCRTSTWRLSRCGRRHHAIGGGAGCANLRRPPAKLAWPSERARERVRRALSCATRRCARRLAHSPAAHLSAMRRQPPASPSPPGKRLGPLQRSTSAFRRRTGSASASTSRTSSRSERRGEGAGLRLGDRVVLLDGVDVSGGRDRVTEIAARRARDAATRSSVSSGAGSDARLGDGAARAAALLFFSSVGARPSHGEHARDVLHLAVGDEGGVASFAREGAPRRVAPLVGESRSPGHVRPPRRRRRRRRRIPPPPPPPRTPACAVASATAAAPPPSCARPPSFARRRRRRWW